MKFEQAVQYLRAQIDLARQLYDGNDFDDVVATAASSWKEDLPNSICGQIQRFVEGGGTPDELIDFINEECR